MREQMSRRSFLAEATAMVGVSAVARPGSAANERIGIGLIGCGGRGSALLGELLALATEHGVEVRALCDVWSINLERAATVVERDQGRRPRLFRRFGELIAASDIDAVIIATPDFAHGPILVEALGARKDVYVEKPMTIDLDEANRALDLARAHACVVQAGTQRRSEGAYRAAAREVATGMLGTITRVSASVNFCEPRWARDINDCREADVDWAAYLFNRPARPFDPRLLRRWQLYRDCTNGLSGLWMSHYVDSVHLLTGARYPASAVAHGGIYLWHDGREHTDVFHALLDYPEGFLFDWAMSLTNSAGNRFAIYGDQGTLDVEAWSVGPGGGRPSSPVSAHPISADPNRSHMGNWLDCIRSRERPAADIEFGHQHAVATILAARALETGTRQHYDAARRAIGTPS